MIDGNKEIENTLRADGFDVAADKFAALATQPEAAMQDLLAAIDAWAIDPSADAEQRILDARATLSPAEPSPESREGWQPIETLTKGDGYVLGWSGRSDDCGEREYFMGRLYDIRPGALLNEWTGRWRGATHWRPLPSPPASAIRALSAPAHD
jgi:hypothetical protein